MTHYSLDDPRIKYILIKTIKLLLEMKILSRGERYAYTKASTVEYFFLKYPVPNYRIFMTNPFPDLSDVEIN